MADRKKVVVGILLSVSLALNFFSLGWLVARSPLFPDPMAGAFGDRPPFPPFSGEAGALPEEHILEMITHGMSPEGKNRLLEAIAVRVPKIEELAKENARIREQLKAELREEEPDVSELRQRLRDHDKGMSQRLAIVGEVVASVLPELDVEDRRVFIRNWEMRPGGGDFPPPPPPPMRP